MFKYKEIVEWGRVRGLVGPTASVTAQVLKGVEEFAEFLEHSSKGQDIADDIGDMYVTMVLAHAIRGYTNKDIYTPEPSKGSLEECKVALMELFVEAVERPVFELQIALLARICEIYELQLNNCIELAYNEISARTGKTVNGVFIKDVN